MSVDDMDAFRAELLRQKIIFEAELRRQRETFDERITRMAQDLADREADCRNLQAVVTILGKKVDALMERRGVAPMRRSSPMRTGSVTGGDDSTARRDAAHTTPLMRVPSPSNTRNSSPYRRIANASSLTGGAAAGGMHAPSSHSVSSRQNSPSRAPTLSGRRPRLGKADPPDHISRRSVAHQVHKSKTADDW